MEEKIKDIYLVLGIILLVLLITYIGLNILNVEVKLNPNFFTFNKKACLEEMSKLKEDENYIKLFGGMPESSAKKSLYEQYLAEKEYEELSGKPLPSIALSNPFCKRPSLFIVKNSSE